MTRIEIIATPPGEAPGEIRREWVGLILPIPVTVPQDLISRGVLSGKIQALADGYDVELKTAIEILARKSPKAAEWWRENYHLGSQWLQFSKEVCRVV